MSRLVYFAARQSYPIRVPEEYTEIYETCLKKPLKGQSIKQMECTTDSCFFLTTEMSQVFYMDEMSQRDPEHNMSTISPLASTCMTSYDYEAIESDMQHLAALDSCLISLIGTAKQSTFYYSSALNQLWFTGVNLIDSSPMVPELIQVKLPIELHNKEIVKMNGNDLSMFFLTNDGLLYALGSSYKGVSRVEIPAIVDNVNSPVFVTDVQSGCEHTLILLSNGQCFGIGSSSHGQLTSKGTKTEPTLCNVPGKVTWIRPCSYHSFFGTEEGVVYACGYNSDHRLALSSDGDSVISPQPIDFPTGQVKHVLGFEDTMIVDQKNMVYTAVISASSGEKSSVDTLSRPIDMIQHIQSDNFIIHAVSGSINFKCLYLEPNTESKCQSKL